MPGQQLTCVFSVAASRNASPSNRHTLKAVSIDLGQRLKCCTFIEAEFDERLKEDRVRFESFLSYAVCSLRTKGESDEILFSEIESCCWELLKKKYTANCMNEAQIYRLWCIFNRLADETTFPPTVHPDVLVWYGDQLPSTVMDQWQKASMSSAFGDEPITFVQFLDCLSCKLLCRMTQSENQAAVQEMSSWLVEEVVLVGRMWKRTKKLSNWSGWVKRWVSLNANSITYYDAPKMKSSSMKGKIYINKSTSVEIISSEGGKFSNRLKISNKPYIEMELTATDSCTENAAWVDALGEVICAKQEGTTPVRARLQELFPVDGAAASNHVTQSLGKRESGRKSKDVGYCDKRQPHPKYEEDKMKVIFLKIDTSKDGRIDFTEFQVFLKTLGLQLAEKEADPIFRSIDSDDSGKISYDEFTNYFADVVFNESELNLSGSKLRKAFLSADKDGSGALNFREFANYLHERKRSIRISCLLEAFSQFDVNQQGDVHFDEFKRKYQDLLCQDTMVKITEESDTMRHSAMFESKLRDFYSQTQGKELAEYIHTRWHKFTSFKRLGGNGEIVMTTGHNMVKDIVPGEYSLLDLAMFTDLPAIQPKFTTVKGFKWVPCSDRDDSDRLLSGQALFPPEFDGCIATEFATAENVRYYGCSFAEGQQLKISLLYRHGIQDFKYEDQYLQEYVTTTNGGAGLERHKFSHLDCPGPFDDVESTEDYGHFILAKMVGDDELHVTAFRVPMRHTLYIPGGVIHCNDYLKGTWRTMLSDETDIDHVHLMKPTGTMTGTAAEHFQFTFS